MQPLVSVVLSHAACQLLVRGIGGSDKCAAGMHVSRQLERVQNAAQGRRQLVEHCERSLCRPRGNPCDERIALTRSLTHKPCAVLRLSKPRHAESGATTPNTR